MKINVRKSLLFWKKNWIKVMLQGEWVFISNEFGLITKKTDFVWRENKVEDEERQLKKIVSSSMTMHCKIRQEMRDKLRMKLFHIDKSVLKTIRKRLHESNWRSGARVPILSVIHRRARLQYAPIRIGLRVGQRIVHWRITVLSFQFW